MTSSFEWPASVVCDSGPVLVLEHRHLSRWTGSLPFTELRRTEADGARRFGDRRRVLHFEGTLGGAGEQFVECADEAEAIARLEGLVALARANCPDAAVTTYVDEGGIERTRIVDPTSGGILEADLLPASEYDESWQEHPDDEGWFHAFDDDARAVFWQVEGRPTIDVGVTNDREALLLLRWWASDDLDDARGRARDLAARASLGDTDVIGEFEVTDTRLVVLWSPIAGRDLVAPEATRLDAPSLRGVGATVPIRPGRYRVTIGETAREATTRARWCRWSRVGNVPDGAGVGG